MEAKSNKEGVDLTPVLTWDELFQFLSGCIPVFRVDPAYTVGDSVDVSFYRNSEVFIV